MKAKINGRKKQHGHLLMEFSIVMAATGTMAAATMGAGKLIMDEVQERAGQYTAITAPFKKAKENGGDPVALANGVQAALNEKEGNH